MASELTSSAQFLVDAVIAGGVLGLRPGVSMRRADVLLGPDFLDDATPAFVRRDYGLFEATFYPDPPGWVCAFLTLEMHRVAVGDDGLVPALVQDMYGGLGGPVRMTDVERGLRDLGVVPELIQDNNPDTFIRYFVAQAGCVLHVQNDDEGTLQRGDVWSMTISRPEDAWIRPM